MLVDPVRHQRAHDVLVPPVGGRASPRATPRRCSSRRGRRGRRRSSPSDGRQQPADRRVAPALVVEPRVLLEVGTSSPGGSDGSRRVSMNARVPGDTSSAYTWSPSSSSTSGQSLARLVAHAQRQRAQGVDLAAALVLVLAQRVRRLVRRRHAARAEHQPRAASPSGSVWKRARRASRRRAARRARRRGAPRTRARCPGSGRRSRRARSGGRRTQKVRSRRAEHLHLARPRPSPPRARPRSRRRSAAAVRGRARAQVTVPTRGNFRTVESELQDVGRAIHAALPARSRHPLRALDERAMELASQDAELRAALFRFVDVTPACRSLDDLARHLAGYLEEVDDRPPPIEAAMRMSGTRPGRAALGAAAAAGVRHMAHRFIVGETPAGGAEGDPPPVGRRRGRRRSTCSARRRSPQAEADRYAARCLEALETLARGGAVVARAPGARARLDRAAAAREPVGEGVRAHAADASRRRPSSAATTPRAGCARCSVRAKELGAHLHIDMESVDTLEATLELVFELLDEPELRRGPVGRRRAPGVPARVAAAARPAARLGGGHRARAAARRPAGEGRVLGPRGGRGAPARLDAAGVRGQGATATATSRSSRAACSTRARTCGSRSPRTTCARSRTRSPTTAPAGGEDRDLELQVLRGLGDDLAEALAGSATRVRATARSATWSPAWRTWSAACSRTPRTSRSSASSSAARRSRSCWRRREPFANEPVLELRRAPVREALLEALRGARRALPLRGARADRRRPRPADAFDSTDPGHAGARGRRARARHARTTPAAAVEAAERGFREWAARPRPSAREVLRARRGVLRERRLELAALQVRECAKPWAEADADVCEAIDFLEYYAREAVALDEGRALRPGAGRAQRHALRAARRGRGHRALELPARHPMRHDRGGARRRATPSCSSRPSSRRRERRRARGGAARGRRARRRARAPARLRRGRAPRWCATRACT